MDMCEICTEAHPTLNKAGSVIYQRSFILSEVTVGSLMKFGYIKMPAKVGRTKNEPKKYHGVLLPHLVVILSLKSPTIGVIIPSAS